MYNIFLHLRYVIIFLLIIVVLLLSACSSTSIAGNGAMKKKVGNDDDRVKGEYLVKLKQDGTKDMIKNLYGTYGIESIKSIGERLYKIRLKSDPGPDTITNKAKRSDSIEYAEPNYIYRITPPGKKVIQKQ